MNTVPVLPAELTIHAVADTARAWLSWLDDAADGAPLAIDASTTADVDGAGVQLLVALANALRQRGRALELQAPSAVLADACLRLGADFLLAATPAKEPVR